MTEIPEDKLTPELLASWYEMADQLKSLRASEALLRKSIFKKAFPNPKEGTNKYELDDGYVLSGKYALTRSVDEGAYSSILDNLYEAKIKVDKLVKFKPSISKSEYSRLTDEQRDLFDQCLVIKPGSPSLDIILPAKNKPKGA